MKPKGWFWGELLSWFSKRDTADFWVSSLQHLDALDLMRWHLQRVKRQACEHRLGPSAVLHWHMTAGEKKLDDEAVSIIHIILINTLVSLKGRERERDIPSAGSFSPKLNP